MPPKNRIIIDTDPGVDDVLALLWALSAPASELETVMISVSFGNVDVQSCTRNVVAVFETIGREVEWRERQGLPIGFEGVTKFKPIVAIGASEALHDASDKADDFHGRDGLGGVHTSHPHLSPKDDWMTLFDTPSTDSRIAQAAGDTVDLKKATTLFTPSFKPAPKEILRLLRENEANTISLISIGPLTNFALAAAEDPETFLRAKQVITMGGAVENFGNITPVAEFNVSADAIAAARVYALSSPNPASTIPNVHAETLSGVPLPPYPSSLSKQQKTVLMSLDITEYHTLSRKMFMSVVEPLAQQGSPLAEWCTAFAKPMLDKMEILYSGQEGEGEGPGLPLHDPMCVWYVLTEDSPGWKASDKSPEDIRVEIEGKWTKGMTVGDKRLRRRRNSDGERPYDRGDWLGNSSGNRIYRMLESPGRDKAALDLLSSVFGKASGR